MRDFLTDRETAKILGKRIDTLYNTVDFFDRYDDDEWDLVEGEHFEFVQKSGNIRERRFTEEGVEALARYFETQMPGLLDGVLELLTHRRRRRKRMLVSRRITQELLDHGGMVEMKDGLAFVNKKTTIKILQTNGLGLKNSIKRLASSGSLEGQEGIEIDKHFVVEEDGTKAWSQKGIASIAVDMRNNAKITKSRKAWMDAVGDVVEVCFAREIKRLQSSELRISKAIKSAKRAANEACQVTGCKRARGHFLELDGHHLFDRHTRPDLDDFHDNILVLETSLHRDFHSWNGGGPCMPKDFSDYLHNVRSDLLDSVNSRSAERQANLFARLHRLQKNYEGFKLRY